jgi:hypothetical protein
VAPFSITIPAFSNQTPLSVSLCNKSGFFSSLSISVRFACSQSIIIVFSSESYVIQATVSAWSCRAKDHANKTKDIQ